MKRGCGVVVEISEVSKINIRQSPQSSNNIKEPVYRMFFQVKAEFIERFTAPVKRCLAVHQSDIRLTDGIPARVRLKRIKK
ncbi:MAG: hypothetical protein CL840_18410 [Crocinitomicaceae bacterium]|nr:hypothetical protein [Crocinitomicaceae bacterium]|tara:strand:+ start:4410 stop:4652 length:243 start_codon:yes stop_codon:yes gene_type:complete